MSAARLLRLENSNGIKLIAEIIPAREDALAAVITLYKLKNRVVMT